MTYYQQPVNIILADLKTSVQSGLTDTESAMRLQKDGHNRIKRTHKRNMFQVFLEQFKNTLVILLIVAAVISLFL